MSEIIPPKKSWRTTTAGILALIASLIPSVIALIDGDPATVIDTNEIGSAIMGFFVAYMGVAARDNKVTSENVKAAEDAKKD